ncbi:universal stress protein UspA [Solibacillus sp. R5-41]|uniref:universal stress protein n=1 Tax=Solibacillus sp. R5-41 TaxID=2048654 RepID=UPI000C1287C2|nr:universal stress protein [Solibacillus sp. R5-41]ATP41307.1 universal stress protein UspA [Solibacillus sp. R5-41]
MGNHYQNIVVAVDGSKEAELAFRKGIDVAIRNVGSTLHIVHVIDTSVSTSVEMLYENMIELVQKHGEVLLENYRTQATEAGVTNVKTIITNGVPKTILSKKLAELVPVDLIICGATGLNAAEQFFIGSNTEAIVRHSKCDVLVVRTPE